jgi:hypothetical protein
VDTTNLRSEVPIGARARQDQNREPQTGSLPDGTLDCPACGSEAQPLSASSTPPGLGTTAKHTGRAGWIVASERPAASSTTRIWRGGRPYLRGSTTTTATAPAAKLAEGEAVGFRRLTRGLRGVPDRSV